jgi:hypothetical protein
MKFATRLIMMMVLFATSSSFAVEAQSVSVRTLVDEFYQQKQSFEGFSKLVSNNFHPSPRHDCPPRGPNCLDVACDILGTFKCDDLSEIQYIGAACRGNYDGTCLAATCKKMGVFKCDDLNEIQGVARACVGNSDLSCFESVCNRLGVFKCDDFHEIEEVLRTCAGN